MFQLWLCIVFSFCTTIFLQSVSLDFFFEPMFVLLHPRSNFNDRVVSNVLQAVGQCKHSWKGLLLNEKVKLILFPWQCFNKTFVGSYNFFVLKCSWMDGLSNVLRNASSIIADQMPFSQKRQLLEGNLFTSQIKAFVAKTSTSMLTM